MTTADPVEVVAGPAPASKRRAWWALRQLASDPESSHPGMAMSICSDWNLQPLSHQQVMNLT